MFRKKLGMTLVEVLVALIIGTISVAAMFYSYNIFNRSYQGIVEKASISKSGRNALSQLARELRNVGYKDINQTKGPLEEYLWYTSAPVSTGERSPKSQEKEFPSMLALN